MFTLMEYNFVNGTSTVSAIHALDMVKFMAEHPDAKLYARFAKNGTL